MIKPKEITTIGRIVDRALLLADELGTPLGRLALLMDLTFAHAQVKLRLDELADADDVNFAHDVFGIHRHMNRETKRLGDGFMPRFSSHP